MVLKAVYAIVVSYAAATVGSCLAVLVWADFDLETLGAGMMIPLFIVPAIVGYVFVSHISRIRNWKNAIYFLGVVPWIAGMLWAAFNSPEGRELAMLIVNGLVVASIAAFFVVHQNRCLKSIATITVN
jgi:hypothetical protein